MAPPSASTRLSTASRSPAGATVDRTAYTNSNLTDGSTFSNDDRDFNQYGGVGRFSYELKPGLKPFVEIQGDTRVHDQAADRNGFFRDSNGGYAKVGTSFEFSRHPHRRGLGRLLRAQLCRSAPQPALRLPDLGLADLECERHSPR